MKVQEPSDVEFVAVGHRSRAGAQTDTGNPRESARRAREGAAINASFTFFFSSVIPLPPPSVL